MSEADKITVLVVDDDPQILRFVEVALTQEGYLAITASNGKQALEASRAHPGPINLLLSDIQMPELRGPELCKQIKQERPQIICALMSANVSWASGGLPFIEKPFTAGVLQCRIRELLSIAPQKHPPRSQKSKTVQQFKSSA